MTTTTTTTTLSIAEARALPVGTRVEVSLYGDGVWQPATISSIAQHEGLRDTAPDNTDYVLVLLDNPHDGWGSTYTSVPSGKSLRWVDHIRTVSEGEATTSPAEPTGPTVSLAVARGILSLIGEELANTAERSEWCGEYENRVIDLVYSLRANYGTRAVGLIDAFEESARRQRSYDVVVDYTVSGSVTVTVDARNEEDAREKVQEDLWSYIDSYTVRDNVDMDSLDVSEVYVD